jgi:hypothetical protein
VPVERTKRSVFHAVLTKDKSTTVAPPSLTPAQASAPAKADKPAEAARPADAAKPAPADDDDAPLPPKKAKKHIFGIPVPFTGG